MKAINHEETLAHSASEQASRDREYRLSLYVQLQRLQDQGLTFEDCMLVFNKKCEEE